ncbi:MAG: ABC transporter ATP-binding protein [Armatimonadetes bacterium]|nr:ABC transporter ATP-binding protein [Armatimonadota bacterium]
MDAAILTRNLTKRYRAPKRQGWSTALDGLNLNVPEGIIFGFLGPNGAGKTTTIKLLLDFISPTAGAAFLFGASTLLPESRRRVGYLPEQPYFHRFLTPAEVLKVHGAMLGMRGQELTEAVAANLDRVGIASYKDLPLSKLSKGNAQRVGLAQALMGSPRLLILDEPGSGLDPVGRRAMRDLLAALKSEGTTVFLSSHLLSEIESLCDRIGVLSGGKLVAEGAPDGIVRTTSRAAITLRHISPELFQAFAAPEARIEDRGRDVLVEVPTENLYEAIHRAEACGAEIVSIAPIRESLEEAFLRLVGSAPAGVQLPRAA